VVRVTRIESWWSLQMVPFDRPRDFLLTLYNNYADMPISCTVSNTYSEIRWEIAKFTYPTCFGATVRVIVLVFLQDL